MPTDKNWKPKARSLKGVYDGNAPKELPKELIRGNQGKKKPSESARKSTRTGTRTGTRKKKKEQPKPAPMRPLGKKSQEKNLAGRQPPQIHNAVEQIAEFYGLNKTEAVRTSVIVMHLDLIRSGNISRRAM